MWRCGAAREPPQVSMWRCDGGAEAPHVAMRRWWAAHALLPDGLATGVTFTVDGGRFTDVMPGTARGEATELPGVVLPGFADAHSHAFHRALRGRTHHRVAAGSFWTWRDQMYALAGRLDPDS